MTALILLLAMLAGACSLSFEVLWVRQLTIEAGGPLASFTIVICCYMLGLAAGSTWLGRAADRSARPGHLFGLLQTAGAGILFLAAGAVSRGGTVRPLLEWLAPPPGGMTFLLVELAAGGSVAVAVAFVMGGTLPALVTASGRLRQAGQIGREAGRLAALNAAGAALGALVCGFLMLPALGMKGSLLATAVATALTGAVALIVFRRAAPPPPMVPTAPRAGATPGAPARQPLALLVTLLFAMGLSVTALEVVWTRLAMLSFGSSVQAGSLVLAAVIAGLAGGNALGARWSSRPAPSSGPRGRLAALACLTCLALLATDPLLGRLPLAAAWMGDWAAVPGDAGSFSWAAAAAHAGQLALIFAIALIPCLLLGAVFPVSLPALAASRRPGRAVGLLSAAISAGNLAGAPAAYFGILGSAGSRGCLMAAAGVLAAAGLVAAGTAAGMARLRALAAALLVLTAASATLMPWDPAVLSSGPFLYGALYEAASTDDGRETMIDRLRRRGAVVFSREGPDALVTVRRQPMGLLSLQVNGKTDASTGGDMKTQMLMSHLPLLLSGAQTPGRVLVIGLGSGVTAAVALAHPVRQVDVVEISPEVIEAAPLFSEAQQGALSDPRLRLTRADARSVLLPAPRGAADRFDVIASQPSNPWVAGQALLFTREFFGSARRHLSPGGVMCQWVQGAGLSSDDFRSVVATFAAVFPDVSLWEESTAGGDYLLLGSEAAAAIEPETLARRMEAPAVRAGLDRVEVESVADLLSHYVMGRAALERYVRGSPLQTEDRLSLEFTAPGALRRDTLGDILESLEPFRESPVSLASGHPGLALELAQRSRSARRERDWAAGFGLLSAGGGADPDLPRALAYVKAGMRRHALTVLEALALRRPSDRMPRLLLGHLYMSMPESGSMERAIRELQAAMELDPEEPHGHLYLARALYAAGRLEPALAENERAHRALPRLPEAASDRCAMLLAAGDAASAEAACLDAIARDDSLAEAHANLGVTQSRRGRLEAAERSYRRALELDPSLADARYNLAALCERQHRVAEGLAALAPLLEQPGLADAETLRLAARLALGSSDRKAASLYLSRSLALEPENKEALEMERMLR